MIISSVCVCGDISDGSVSTQIYNGVHRGCTVVVQCLYSVYTVQSDCSSCSAERDEILIVDLLAV